MVLHAPSPYHEHCRKPVKKFAAFMIAAAWKVIERGTEIADRDVVEIGQLLGPVRCVLVLDLVISFRE